MKRDWISDFIFVLFVLITIAMGVFIGKWAALITGFVLTLAFIGIEIYLAPKDKDM